VPGSMRYLFLMSEGITICPFDNVLTIAIKV
jgi:hypothetical protein